MWNPVKELKEGEHRVGRRAFTRVESGEGIESRNISDGKCVVSITEWNPVKELKGVSWNKTIGPYYVAWNPVKELKVKDQDALL